uniref:Uncharacterized protein n=1 Tax=Arundo donax TaxID=35708 RepID=A0A0A9AZK3_ARUDO
MIKSWIEKLTALNTLGWRWYKFCYKEIRSSGMSLKLGEKFEGFLHTV